MRFLCLAVAFAFPALVVGADPLEVVIDRHVDAKLKAESVAPASQRRLTFLSTSASR